jgi:hypothetical protein
MDTGGTTMTNKLLESLWELYPESHIHCDVTNAGQDAYRIVVSLIDSTGEVIGSTDYYGNGELDVLKERAFERLAMELQQAIP